MKNQQQQQQTSTKTNNSKTPLNDSTNTKTKELIELKFNQLAKKILDELDKPATDLFEAIDEIIKEPPGERLAVMRARARSRADLSKLCTSQEQRPAAVPQQSTNSRASVSPDKQPVMSSVASAARQASLVNDSNAITKSRQRPAAPQNSSPVVARQSPASALPAIYAARQAAQQPDNQTLKVSSSSNQASRIHRSATFDDSQKRLAAPANSVVKSTIATAISMSPKRATQQTSKASSQKQQQQSVLHRQIDLYAKQKNFSTGNVLSARNLANYDNRNENDDGDDDDDNDDEQEDEESDDSDETTDDNDVELWLPEEPVRQVRSRSSVVGAMMERGNFERANTSGNNNQQQSYVKQNQTSIKQYNNKQASDNSEQREATVRPQQQQQSTAAKQRQRFAPIVRSNTIGATSHDKQASSIAKTSGNKQETMYRLQQQQKEPRSMSILTSNDIRSLYKPHMNYSTSVLGNHRLSDDDEIIIIPTQSPSMISPSPDMMSDATIDELKDRFSISRTKNFWEKLSKASPGERPGSSSSNTATSGGVNSSNKHYAAEHSPRGSSVSPTKNHSQYTHNYDNYDMRSPNSVLASRSPGNSVVGVRVDAHPTARTLDHMDSTGGSNSNYSCSSSGDENCNPNMRHNNLTLSQLEELSRQNRLRQTR